MEIHRTKPHGEHGVMLVEDHTLPGRRLYEVTDRAGRKVGFTGEEMASLAAWWAFEGCRPGVDGDEP